MSKLNDFLGGRDKPSEDRPQGIEWFAAVRCQICHEEVEEQMLFPNECVLIWTCSKGHRSTLENFSVF